jgi:hypothetical protein
MKGEQLAAAVVDSSPQIKKKQPLPSQAVRHALSSFCSTTDHAFPSKLFKAPVRADLL